MLRQTFFAHHRQSPVRAHEFCHFYNSVQVVRFCGGGDPIVEVELTEVPDSEVDGTCYWGWWDEEQRKLGMIQFTKQLLDMCFPYGLDDATERGKGRAVPLKATLLRTVASA